ncbi:TetR/AcrR family transcriptional regulator [Dactylosporangium sp. CA-092794]|uniref:TetR/AcrR family transcriptional regulator n=1 Tax=Dactylosporangium sp. CA-092794 TaxID=3239929 RepID=UPI003D91020A
MAAEPARAGRASADRSASMQWRLLDAAIAVLDEKGYSGTTTLEVQSRAGVSRGALLHHFGSRTELMLAAVNHLAQRRLEAILRLVRTQAPDTGRIEWAVRVLWSQHDGPLFRASVALWLAARTDPGLLAALLPQERVVGHSIRAVAAELFGPEVAEADGYGDALDIVIDAMRGAAAREVLRAPGSDDRLIRLWSALISDRVGLASQL